MPAPPPSHLLAGGGAGWTPLKPTTIEIPAEHKPAIVRMLRRDGHSDALTALIVADRDCYQNDRYLVDVIRERDGVIVALSIRRHDGEPCHDWRDFQRIKNEVAGEDVEAVELYPAESRLVDNANIYWLWCKPPGTRFDFGCAHRSVMEAGDVGNRQRPL
jgi:hypothetical protein